MESQELKGLLDLLYLVVFTAGVTLMAGRLWTRIRWYRKAKWPIPARVWRDVVLFTGLAIPFLAIFLVRALIVVQPDIGEALRDEVAWTVLTGTPPVIAIWLCVWIEFIYLGDDDLPVKKPK